MALRARMGLEFQSPASAISRAQITNRFSKSVQIARRSPQDKCKPRQQKAKLAPVPRSGERSAFTRTSRDARGKANLKEQVNLFWPKIFVWSFGYFFLIFVLHDFFPSFKLQELLFLNFPCPSLMSFLQLQNIATL